MGKALGSKNLMVAFFICNRTSITWPFLCKSRKMSRDRTVDLENGCDRTREGVTYGYLVRQKALEQTQKVSPQAQKVSLMVALTTAGSALGVGRLILPSFDTHVGEARGPVFV